MISLRFSSRYCLCWILFAFCFSCFSVNAQTVRTIGPFDVSFYNAGQSDEDGTGVQNWTGQQIEDITASIATWANRITNTPNRQVKLHLFWASLGGSILGQTYNPTVGDGTTSWTDTERVWRTGTDPIATTSYDARIELSTGYSWNIGTGTPSFSQYDFRSVITHELGHTLGFDSTYDPGTDRFSSLGLTTWDKNLRDNINNSISNQPVAGGFGAPNNFIQTANPDYFVGPNAVAYNAGNVAVYAPNPYQSGSSLSHLDGTAFPSALMRPAFVSGTATRTPTALEWEIMKDLGWSVTGVKNWTKGAGTLNWSDATNWGPTGLPDSSWNVGFTSTGLANGNTINLGASRTINSLSIDSTVSFTIGGGSGSLNLNSGNITRSAASSGTQTISQPVSVGSNTVWDIAGADSLVISGSLTATNSITKIGSGILTLAGSANVPGNFILDDGDLTLSSTLSSTGALTVNNMFGNGGTLNFDGGTLNITGTNSLHLYGVRVGRDAPGSFTLLPGKTLTTDVFLTIGRDTGGQGTFTNQGGNVIANTNLFVGANSGSNGHFVQQSSPNPGDPLPSTSVANITYVGYTSGSSGLLEMKSGTYNTLFLEPGYGSPGTFTQTGGTVTVTGSLELAHAAQGTYNLNGGTLKLNTLIMGTGAAAFNFGGGTMQATGTFTSAVPVTLSGVNGDAVFDTQSFNVSLSSAVSGSGGLKKMGTGTLTLTNSANYSGTTTISAGMMILDGASSHLHAITGSGKLVVGNDSITSLLTADSINLNTLTITAGSKITINPIPGGPLALTPIANLTSVPEPSTPILLLLAALIALGYRKRKAPI